MTTKFDRYFNSNSSPAKLQRRYSEQDLLGASLAGDALLDLPHEPVLESSPIYEAEPYQKPMSQEDWNMNSTLR